MIAHKHRKIKGFEIMKNGFSLVPAAGTDKRQIKCYRISAWDAPYGFTFGSCIVAFHGSECSQTIQERRGDPDENIQEDGWG